MPGRSVGDQGVPPLRAPALGDAVPLQDEVRHAAVAQVLAHRQAGLASTDDEYVDLVARHHNLLLRGSPVLTALRT